MQFLHKQLPDFKNSWSCLNQADISPNQIDSICSAINVANFCQQINSVRNALDWLQTFLSFQAKEKKQTVLTFS